MAYIEILKINPANGTEYRVIDWTAEKISKTHPQEHYQYLEKGDIITAIDNLEIGNLGTGKIIQLLKSANTIGVITHATCRCDTTKKNRPADTHHPPKPHEEKKTKTNHN